VSTLASHAHSARTHTHKMRTHTHAGKSWGLMGLLSASSKRIGSVVGTKDGAGQGKVRGGRGRAGLLSVGVGWLHALSLYKKEGGWGEWVNWAWAQSRPGCPPHPWTHRHARTHARTHARSLPRTHAHAHTQYSLTHTITHSTIPPGHRCPPPARSGLSSIR